MLFALIFKGVNQLFDYSFIRARAKGAVKMQLPSYAGRADILYHGFFQVPAAGAAERGRVSFNLGPALGAHQVIHARDALQFSPAGQAYLRVNDIRQALPKLAQHIHIITIKFGFVKIIDRDGFGG